MLRHYEKLLRLFPFSPRNPSNSILRVQAISYSEPPLIEQAFPDPLDVDAVVSAAAEFVSADNSYHVESWWGLWQFDREWSLRPARVTLSCFGPLFEDESGHHLRIDCGLDVSFLPQPGVEGSPYHVQSNVRGLLTLARGLDEALAVERRMLISESGENFAETLQEMLES